MFHEKFHKSVSLIIKRRSYILEREIVCRGKLLSRINIQARAVIGEWFRHPVREIIFYQTQRFNWCGFVCQINRVIAIGAAGRGWGRVTPETRPRPARYQMKINGPRPRKAMDNWNVQRNSLSRYGYFLFWFWNMEKKNFFLLFHDILNENSIIYILFLISLLLKNRRNCYYFHDF